MLRSFNRLNRLDWKEGMKLLNSESSLSFSPSNWLFLYYLAKKYITDLLHIFIQEIKVEISCILNWPWWPSGLEHVSNSSRRPLQALVWIPLEACLYGTVYLLLMDLLYSLPMEYDPSHRKTTTINSTPTNTTHTPKLLPRHGPQQVN